MRVISRTSTARCDIETYLKYLLSPPTRTSCERLSNIMGTLTHDSINRFLLREQFEPIDLWNFVGSYFMGAARCIFSVDDSIIDKPYSNSELSKFIGFSYSGKHKKVVKGVCIVFLLCTDIDSNLSLPVNYRVWDSNGNQTKNDLFLEMLLETIERGINILDADN